MRATAGDSYKKNHARITNWASTKAQVGAKFLFHNKTCGR